MDIIKDIIFPVLEEFQEDDDFDFELSNDLELYGRQSIFDSLSLVRFIVNTQDKILEVTGKDVVLVSSEVMNKSQSPFRTVTALAEYIGGFLDE